MPKRNLLLAALMLGAAISVIFMLRDRQGVAPSKDDPANPMQPVGQALRIIKDNYHQPIGEDKLFRGAIGGMVESLDEFSSYVPPDKLAVFSGHINGSYHGLGLKVEMVDGAVVVIGPLMHSPAHRAGIRTGDRIVSIDGREVAGLMLAQVTELLDAGPKNTMTVVIQRGGRREPIPLTREDLPLESVVGLCRNHDGQWLHMVDPKNGLAYVRIREFTPQTVADLERVLRQLGNVRGLVLDLRDNPGGMLSSAVGTANMFLPKGRIVNSLDRSGNVQKYDARADLAWSPLIPMVVLVNGQTASAAEIVAGALWVHDRAVLVGTRTRGKGCVQSMFPLGPKWGQINITTAQYSLDGDWPISRRPGSDTWGIDPHVQAISLHEEKLADLRVRGEVLFLPTPETLPADWSGDNAAAMTGMFLKVDTQLNQALQLMGQEQEMKTLLKLAAQDRIKRKAATSQAAEDEHE